MTTIAYRDGVLAADTLMTADGVRCGRMTKIERRGKALIGFAGAASNYEMFRNWISGGMIGAFESEGGNVLIVAPGLPPIVWGDSKIPWRDHGEFLAFGSGEKIALGAMAAGATAEEAVRIACDLDVYTGGEVTVLHL